MDIKELEALGIKGLVPATNIVAGTRLKIAIVGPMKTGKSWFASSAPKPVLVFDFDNRAESLAGKDVTVKTLVDVDSLRPHVVQDIESDLSSYKYAKEQGKEIFATFVFDSITYFKKSIENELIKQNKEFGRPIRLGINKSIFVPKGWDVINGVRGFLEYIINEFSQLGNIIFVFHQRDEKDRDKSTKEETRYTGRQTVDPQYLETVLALFNEVYYIQITPDGKYQVQVRANYECGASTTMLLDEVEEPDIIKLIAKHRERLALKK